MAVESRRYDCNGFGTGAALMSEVATEKADDCGW
ncbi:unnamed protein product [Toxocara canis]|uniref:Sensor histidine kinase n=1 Tax=Toxocara canis TaxID=6265 RepID=A0A183U9M5_TOXCA|nr:unnamed protein product [Toxocara canis]